MAHRFSLFCGLASTCFLVAACAVPPVFDAPRDLGNAAYPSLLPLETLTAPGADPASRQRETAILLDRAAQLRARADALRDR
jgi:hypothetical protein